MDESIIFLILGLGLFATFQRQVAYRARLKAARRRTAEKRRRVWEVVLSCEGVTRKRHLSIGLGHEQSS
ncbi:hypothetical protein D9C73_000063 [Collichthys lucidus]|uniref:Uncharacterized protein n=1 Tax=Collichthys lucidus TaxID=240159 RepID=A0A4U5TWI3_COLLU|nr:hypothetical protein D9C73_000063 [Collichthys lucidus]